MSACICVYDSYFDYVHLFLLCFVSGTFPRDTKNLPSAFLHIHDNLCYEMHRLT